MAKIEFKIRSTGNLDIKLGGESVSIPLAHYKQAANKSPELFLLLNKYLEHLSRKNPNKASVLSDTYRWIVESMLDVMAAGTPEENLRKAVETIMECVKYDEVLQWLRTADCFSYPDQISKDFDVSIEIDAQGSREQTYIHEDYIKLAAMAVTVKAIMPAIVMFLLSKEKAPYTKMRDFVIWNVVRDLPGFQNEAMEKLQIYIHTTMNKFVGNRSSSAARLEITSNLSMMGVNSDDLEDWVTAGAVLNKLPTSNICERPNSGNLVANIHSLVKNSLTFDSFSKNKLKDKKIIDGGADDEDKTSALEKYNTVTSKLIVGNVEELNWYYGNISWMVKRHYSHLPIRIKDVQVVYSRLMRAPQYVLTYPQRVIVGWVLMDSVDTRAIPYLYKNAAYALVALASEILRHEGFGYMSLLLTSIGRQSGDEIKTLSSKSRIPKRIQEELMTHYPYTQRVRTSRRRRTLEEVTSSLGGFGAPEPVDTNNPIINTIKNISKMLYDKEWQPTAPSEEVQEVLGSVYVTLPPTQEIKTDLASILIAVSGRLRQKEEKIEHEPSPIPATPTDIRVSPIS